MELTDTLKKYGCTLTSNIEKAIYLTRDGLLIDGDFREGGRYKEHSIMEVVIGGTKCDEGFWDKVHNHYGLVRLVPETMIALITPKQILTPIQREKLTNCSYVIEVYWIIEQGGKLRWWKIT